MDDTKNRQQRNMINNGNKSNSGHRKNSDGEKMWLEDVRTVLDI